ncbi:MAG: TerC family protein, partial [bacterium]
MEIVLGIDNIVFLAILLGRVPADRREPIRRLGVGLAVVARIGLLSMLSWLIGMSRPVFTALGRGFSVRECIDSARRVTGIAIASVDGPRRPGDPPVLLADASRIRSELG